MRISSSGTSGRKLQSFSSQPSYQLLGGFRISRSTTGAHGHVPTPGYRRPLKKFNSFIHYFHIIYYLLFIIMLWSCWPWIEHCRVLRSFENGDIRVVCTIYRRCSPRDRRRRGSCSACGRDPKWPPNPTTEIRSVVVHRNGNENCHLLRPILLRN